MSNKSGFLPAPLPENEHQRIDELRLLGLLDTASEERFDRFTQLATDLFQVPTALISLVDENRQWFKSTCGLNISETPRDVAFCAHAILEPRILVIEDTIRDARFAGNPLVTGAPHIRFYAGAVLHGPGNAALGTLCLIDQKPRDFSAQEQQRLLALAAIVEQELHHEIHFQEARQRAFDNAHYDDVTGLPNARLFNDRVAQALAITRRSQDHLLVALLEIRGLLDVRTVLGERTGDELLHACARRLENALSEICTVARWRDEIFALLLPSMNQSSEAAAFLEHVHNVLNEPFAIDGRTLHFEAICGAAVYPEAGLEPEELIQRANLALRDVKQDNNLHWRLYSADISTVMTRRVDLEHHLRQAVRHGELNVVYQPIVDLDSREIHRVEALCRWTDPSLGIISPDEFIPLAEDSKLIFELDRFVISQAVTKLLEWDRAGLRPLSLSVNLSSQSLMHAELTDWLQMHVVNAGLDPSRVALEVTENSLVADMGLARQNIARCRTLGFNVAIDDFGTGFSSFGYLKDLAVDELKLDRVFVREMTERKRDASIASTIIELARDLGLTVVAEGIETYDQLIYLQAYNCEEGQGYYFSTPLEADDLVSRIGSGNTRHN